MMRKFVLAILALLTSASAQAHVSAVPLPEIGSLLDVTHRAAFAIFQTAITADEPAVTTCNMNTGNCTGLDAGTGLFTAANCNGVADNFAAFTSFNTWAKATTTNTNGQLIELVVTGTCNFTTGQALTFSGLAKARLMGYGSTIVSNGHLPSFGSAGASGVPPGICHKGLADAAGCSARISSVSAGATSVTLLNTALCSRFTAGKWAVVTGFDLQGGYNNPYGYPPNPHFFDYAQIVSTTNCAATGAITLSRALAFGYLSTWPNFNSGSVFEADQGGPGTIYALDANWGGEVDIRGVTVSDANNQSIYQGRKVTVRDVTMTGAHCIIPSQNDEINFISVTGTSCNIEVDKLIGTLNYTNTSLDRLTVQSSSTNVLNWAGGSFGTDLNGTPKVANISNVAIPILRLGPNAYGTPTSATCTNCVIGAAVTSFGLTEKALGDPGANVFYTVSGGVFSYPLGATVSNLVNNGSGKLRLTVPSSTGFVTGTFAGISGLFSACSAPSPCGAAGALTVIDGTTIDVTNFNLADVTWSGAGFLYNTAEQERWAVPGTNVFATGQLGIATNAFQVTGVMQSGNFVNIATTLAGAYPTVPLSSGKSFLQVQAPKWTCTNCSGNAQAVDFSGAPPNIPFGSYSNRTWTNTPSVTPLVAATTIGKVTSITVTVSTAYVGTTTPLKFNMPAAVAVGATQTFWNPLFDLRTAGVRVITPAGVTCNGSPGGCGTDANLTLPDPAAVFNGTMTPQMSGGAPTDASWTISAVFIMDQGVVP